MYFVTLIVKNLLKRKVRTALTMLGISIAVTVVICLVGISDDFRESLIKSYEQRGVDLIVVRRGQTERIASSINQDVADQIHAIPGVADVEGGLVDLASLDEKNSTVVPVMGRTAGSFLVRDLRLLHGRNLAEHDLQQTVLGWQLAEQLEKKVGDTIEVYGESFTIVGTFESDNSFDNNTMVLPRAVLQRIQGKDNPPKVTGFSVRLRPAPDDPELGERVRQQIEGIKDHEGNSWNLSATPTRDFMNNTFQLQAAQAMGWVTSLIALLIGGVGMLNTMLMSVFERTGELGILRAIGWRKRRILAMILWESLLLSIGGALTGACCAWLLVMVLQLTKTARIIVPPTLNPTAVLEGCLIALIVGAVGGIYPALRAMHIAPTEAIRHE